MSTQALPDTERLEDLVAEHGLTINDYEVLLHLARAPEQRLRRVDLVDRILLTPSGITRLLEGLERAELVERAQCDEDRRVVYAKLTPAGADKLREAARTHVAGIESLFIGRFSDDELATLASLLSRLPAAGDDNAECDSPES
jgi:DNA-binding MarR family transcriptional regulator